jgi:hypothetical protein
MPGETAKPIGGQNMAKTSKIGRPKIDADAPVPPTMSVARSSRRYKMGREQMRDWLTEHIEGDNALAVMVNGKVRAITARCDRKLGLA